MELFCVLIPGSYNGLWVLKEEFGGRIPAERRRADWWVSLPTILGLGLGPRGWRENQKLTKPTTKGVKTGPCTAASGCTDNVGAELGRHRDEEPNLSGCPKHGSFGCLKWLWAVWGRLVGAEARDKELDGRCPVTDWLVDMCEALSWDSPKDLRILGVTNFQPGQSTGPNIRIPSEACLTCWGWAQSLDLVSCFTELASGLAFTAVCQPLWLASGSASSGFEPRMAWEPRHRVPQLAGPALTAGLWASRSCRERMIPTQGTTRLSSLSQPAAPELHSLRAAQPQSCFSGLSSGPWLCTIISHFYSFPVPDAAVPHLLSPTPPVVALPIPKSSPYVTLQTPLSMGFPRQEYWSGLPFPTPEIKLMSPVSPALAGGFFTTEPVRKPFIF